jgi:hypothetical protein
MGESVGALGHYPEVSVRRLPELPEPVSDLRAGAVPPGPEGAE